MGYNDQKFYARQIVHVTGSATSTASSTVGANNTAGFANTIFPIYFRKTLINKIRVYTVAAPAAGISAQTLTFLNGTNTVGTATPGTAGTYVDVVVTASNAIIGSNSSLAISFVGTATASAIVLGTFQVALEEQEVFTVS